MSNLYKNLQAGLIFISGCMAGVLLIIGLYSASGDRAERAENADPEVTATDMAVARSVQTSQRIARMEIEDTDPEIILDTDVGASRTVDESTAVVEIGAFMDVDRMQYAQITSSLETVNLGKRLNPESYSRSNRDAPMREIGAWIGEPDEAMARRGRNKPEESIGEPIEIPES